MTETNSNKQEAASKKKVFREVADYRIRPHGIRVLLTPISWEEHHNVEGTRTLTAREGMVHDGASIPILLSFLNGPSIQLAATLHDAAYRFQAWDGVDEQGGLVPGGGEVMTRGEADRVIRKAAQVCQLRARREVSPMKERLLSVTHFMQRWIIWLGLRPGGFLAWRRSPAKRDDYDLGVIGEIESIFKAIQLAARAVPNEAKLVDIVTERTSA